MFIFYTGKRELALPRDLPSNVFIFKRRPNLEHTITGIVTSIHSGEGLPESMLEAQQKLVNAPFHERMKIALSRVVVTYGKQEMFEYAVEETEKSAAGAAEIDLESGPNSLTDEEDVDLMCVPLKSRPHDQTGLVPEGEVSLKGLNAMIVKFLGGIGECNHSDMAELFKSIDTDGSGFIDRNEFDEFLKLATKDEFKRDRELWPDEVKETKRRPRLTLQNALVYFSGSFRSKSKKMTPNSIASNNHNFESLFGDESTVEYAKSIANPANGSGNPLEDWSIFYCGGSNKIKSDLKEISRKYGLDFAVEKFDW